MAQTSSTVPGFAMRGIASGVLFMAFFSTLWASIGIGGLQGWGGLGTLIVVMLVGLGLLLGGCSLLLASRRLPNFIPEADTSRGRRTNFWFITIFVTEGVFIGIAGWICSTLHRFDLFFPIMALIVGLHFFPLAALFQLKPYYLVGTLLCLLAIITLLAVPEYLTVGSQSINAHWVILGFGAALILWGVGVGLWLLGRRLLAQKEQI